MKRKRIVVLLIAFMLSLSFSLPAWADSPSQTLTVKSGDTVYGLCQSLGLDYSKCKKSIMALNGLDSEADLGSIRVGQKLRFPMENPESKASGTDDEVEYYVMPYKLKKGEYLAKVYNLWGLNCKDYLDDIEGLNPQVEDLNKLPEGALLYLPTTRENLQNDNYVAIMGHVMQPGETAYSVVTGYGLDYFEMEDELVKYNFGADLAKLQAGKKLLIPMDE